MPPRGSELDDDSLPSHWSPEWTAQVLGVLAVVILARTSSARDRHGVAPSCRKAEAPPRASETEASESDRHPMRGRWRR
jgi:hypothetical protein